MIDLLACVCSRVNTQQGLLTINQTRANKISAGIDSFNSLPCAVKFRRELLLCRWCYSDDLAPGQLQCHVMMNNTCAGIN
jgi:hypothetical protein